METIQEENDNELNMYERESTFNNNQNSIDEEKTLSKEDNKSENELNNDIRYTQLNDSLSNIIDGYQEEYNKELNNSNNKEETSHHNNDNNINDEEDDDDGTNKNKINNDINEENNNEIVTPKPKNETIKEYKAIILGDFGVGKTSLISKYFNKGFNKDNESQNEINQIYKKIIQIDEKITIQLNMWDTAGQEQSGNIIKKFYIDSYGALVVFDLTNKESFVNLQKWINNIKDYCPKDIVYCFVGNKSDLINERKVDYETIKDFVKDDLYYEVSSKTGSNVSLAFEQLAYNIIQKQIEEENNPEKVLRGMEGRKTTDLNSFRAPKIRSKNLCC